MGSFCAALGEVAANGVIVITTKEGLSRDAKSHLHQHSLDEVSERIPMQNTWGQGRGGVYGATRAIWGDYIPDRAGVLTLLILLEGFIQVRKQVLFTTL